MKDIYTRLETCHSFTALQNNACCFMAKDTITFNHERTYSSMLPEMNVRPCASSAATSVGAERLIVPAHTGDLDVEKNFSFPWCIHRHIFLLQMMVCCDKQRRIRQWSGYMLLCLAISALEHSVGKKRDELGVSCTYWRHFVL